MKAIRFDEYHKEQAGQAMLTARRGLIIKDRRRQAASPLNLSAEFYGKPVEPVVVVHNAVRRAVARKFASACAEAGFPIPCDIWYQGVSGHNKVVPESPLPGEMDGIFPGRWVLQPEGVLNAARLGGYIRAVINYPVLLRAIKRGGGTGKGAGTECGVLELFERNNSPGAMNKRISAIHWRAAEILRPFGLAPRWQSVVRAAAHGRQATGKAAVQAAAMSLLSSERGCYAVSYREARKVLAIVAGRDNSSGYALRADDGIHWLVEEFRGDMSRDEAVNAAGERLVSRVDADHAAGHGICAWEWEPKHVMVHKYEYRNDSGNLLREARYSVTDLS